MKPMQKTMTQNLSWEDAHRARLLRTAGWVLAVTGGLVLVTQLILWAHPAFLPPPRVDLLVDGVTMITGGVLVWLVKRRAIGAAAWGTMGFLLGASAWQLWLGGGPAGDAVAALALLVTVVLAFVLLERRNAWVVAGGATAVFISIQLLLRIGLLPEPMSRDWFGAWSFSIVAWTASASIVAGVLHSTMKALRDRLTALRQVEQALRASEERYRGLYQSIRDAIVVTSPKGEILHCNPAFCDLFGYRLDEIQGDDVLAIPGNEEAVRTLQQALRESGSVPETPILLSYKKRSGDVFPGETNVFYLRNDEGGVDGFVGLIRDVTERQRAEAALEAYSRGLEEMVEERTAALREAREKLLRGEKLAMLGQLAASINHELRSPLGNIKAGVSFVDMVLEDRDADVDEALSIVDRSVDRAVSIVDSLLSFARTEKPSRQAVYVTLLIEEVLSETQIPETVELMRRGAEAPLMIWADPEHLRRVVGNLVNNAVEAMPDGGQLSVETSLVAEEAGTRDRDMVITVSDTGIGIPEEHLERIFEPLFSRKTKGIGLGLALVRTLVEAHGGTVGVESQVGVGTTFTVRLPVGEGE